MTWFKVDDGLHSHPKWIATPPAARALWVTAGSWASNHLTDGHIPRHALTALGGRPRDAADLVRNGLWETTDDGWRFHEWHTDSDGARRNPTKEEVEAERAAARERQRRARDKARMSRRDARRDSRDDSRHDFGPPDPTRPVTNNKGGENLQAAADQPPPRRCPAHQNVTGTVPPCGDCADARRTHDTWQTHHATTNGTSPPRPPCDTDCTNGWIDHDDGSAHRCPACNPDPLETTRDTP